MPSGLLSTNFAIGFLASGVANGATSLTLVTGQGARFPVPTYREYEIVVWNATDYATAGDAFLGGECNVYRVSARTADTFTVVQVEGTADLDTPGVSYRVEIAITRINAAASGRANVLEFGVENDDSLSSEELQTALDKTAGDTLFLPPGLYATDEKLDVPPGTTIDAYGATLRGADLTKDIFYVSGADGLTCKGLALTYDCPESEYFDQPGKSGNVGRPIYDGGTGVGVGSEDVTLVDMKFFDTPIQAVAAWDTPRNWVIERCTAKRIGKGGFVLVNAIACKVLFNYLEKTGDDAIALNLDSKDCQAIGNSIFLPGWVFGQGAGIKSHGQGTKIIANYVRGGAQGNIRIQLADSGGGAGPDECLVALNVLDRLYDWSVAEAAAVRLDDVPGRVQVVLNLIDAGLYTIDGGGAEVNAENADVCRIENSPAMELEFSRNRCRGNHSGAVKFGMNFQQYVKRLIAEDNEWDVGSTLCRFAASGAKMQAVDWVGNRCVRSSHAASHLQFVTGGNGAERVYFVMNRNRGSAASNMLNAGDVTIDELYHAMNVQGGASAEVSNASGAVVRKKIDWTTV